MNKSGKNKSEDHTTHFGYQSIPESEKSGRVHDVFERVASRYDLMNDLMSIGVHRLWKSAMIDWLAPRSGMQLIDVAGGTGDIAFRFMERLNGTGHVTLCDLTSDMLMVGRERSRGKPWAAGLDWICGDGMQLPFASGRFDAYTIAFGIRNITKIDEALSEAYRVLRPGGRFLCLEFSEVVLPVFDAIYERYSFEVIPRLGELVARDRASYQYLVESIRRFPLQDEFAATIEQAGFARVSYRNMTGGVVALHSGWKI